MDMTPQEIAGTTFRVVKRGFDPDEVRSFQLDAAHAMESAQNLASVMEQRARAAVAKAQELSAAAEQASAEPVATSNAVSMRSDDAETISRTLVLAQRTAERAIAEAELHATEIRRGAETDAERTLEGARAEAAKVVADARAEARRAGEAERVRVMSEVQALLARLDFLREDVHEMETYAMTQRQQLGDAAEALRAVADSRVGGIAELRRPILSPAAEMTRDAVAPGAGSAAAKRAPSPEPLKVAPVPAAVAPVAVAVPAVAAAAIAPTDSTPGVGSPLLPPLELTFADMPTGEIPAVRPTSGPVAVPDLDDWPEDPSVRIRVVRPNDLRIVGDD